MGRPVVLGINAAHDASACLLDGGLVVSAIAEERLTRRKHQDGLPRAAIEYCLRAAGLPGIHDVDCIVVNQYPQTDIAGALTRDLGVEAPILTNPSHHLLHAYYAWAASGRDETAILIADGSGYSFAEYLRRGSPHLGSPPDDAEMREAESVYAVRNGAIEVVAKRWGLLTASRPLLRFPSLGHMFSAASQYIFGHLNHAGKTMGLAPYGDPKGFPSPIVSYRSDGLRIDTDWVLRLPPRSQLPAHLDRTCRDLAAKVQAELEEALLFLVRDLHARTGVPHLCLSGGVALNSVANGRIVREGPFTSVFVTPAAHDAGIAIGAALFGHQHLTGVVPSWRAHRDFHGRGYPHDEVLAALDMKRSLVGHTTPVSAAQAAARDIASGLVVGWYEGGSEFGPRALGHRSILADPSGNAMRDHLNAAVKFREPFRPYAASVLAERASEYFDMTGSDPFMLTVADVSPAARHQIASVCHVDGTCRVQTVDANEPGSFRQLIEAFAAITGIPLVLNTSFNVRGEPIVESPADALQCFLSCNMDVLYLEGRRVTKVAWAAADDPTVLVPHLTDGVTLGAHTARSGPGWAPAEHHAVTRTGFKVPITLQQDRILRLIDANRDVHAISAVLADADPAGVRADFETLQSLGLVAFGLTGQASGG